MSAAVPIRVFLVDDHPLVREWLCNLLREDDSLQVTGTAATAREGLAQMLAVPPDVAVIDLVLSDSSGIDLIKDLGAHLPAVRVIVLSMHEEMIFIERAFRAGARGYVTKRESTEQIVEAVREVASGRIYGSRQTLARLAERAVSPGLCPPGGEVERLSDRELEVFGRIGSGQSTRRIANELNVSIKTVQAYCARIKEKLGCQDGAALVRDAVRWVDRQDHRTS